MPNANFPTVVDRMDVTNDPTSATTTWTTLVDSNGKSLVKAFSCRSGRMYELGRTDTGTATVEVENSDGRFDPTNATSPLNSAGKSLLPMRRYNRQATWNGVTYDVWTGFVERYPQTYRAAGFLGIVVMTCVDALAPLSRVVLPSMYQAEVLADSPVAYYPLDEAAGATSAGSYVGTSVGSAQIIGTKAAGGTTEFGVEGGTNDGETGVSLTSSGSAPQAGKALDLPLEAKISLSGGAALECWVKMPTQASGQSPLLVAQMPWYSTAVNYVFTMEENGGRIVVSVTDALGATQVFVNPDVNLDDDEWHHVVASLSSDAKTVTAYVDGASVGSDSTGTAMSNTQADAPSEGLWIGGRRTPTDVANVGTMTIANVATYDAPLSATRVLAHYSAGLGWLNDGTGTRAARYLDAIDWPPAARDLDTGNSTVGAVSVKGTTVAQGLADLAEWEAGFLYIASDGDVTFRQRGARFNAVSQATFGDGSGELPYEGDIEFDFDNTSIYNDIQVERTGGASVRVVDTASQSHFFPSTLSQAIGIDSDAQATDRANYLLGAYKDPHLRLQTLTIKPSSNTALWPHALGRKIGDRITVKKHAGSAPDISADFFIESVEHTVPGNGTWTTSWQLSPAGSGVSDFWVVEDATYGWIEGSGANVSYPIAY